MRYEVTFAQPTSNHLMRIKFRWWWQAKRFMMFLLKCGFEAVITAIPKE